METLKEKYNELNEARKMSFLAFWMEKTKKSRETFYYRLKNAREKDHQLFLEFMAQPIKEPLILSAKRLKLSDKVAVA